MYKIISRAYNRGNGKAEQIDYFILRKRWYGWSRVTKGEGVHKEAAKFSTYDKAEAYIVKVFSKNLDSIIKDGNCYRIGHRVDGY